MGTVIPVLWDSCAHKSDGMHPPFSPSFLPPSFCIFSTNRVQFQLPTEDSTTESSLVCQKLFHSTGSSFACLCPKWLEPRCCGSPGSWWLQPRPHGQGRLLLSSLGEQWQWCVFQPPSKSIKTVMVQGQGWVWELHPTLSRCSVPAALYVFIYRCIKIMYSYGDTKHCGIAKSS